jgi:hypothetical protein
VGTLVRAFARAASLVALLGVAAPAAAHEVGLSYGRYTLTSTALTLELTLAERELAGLVTGLDADGDGHLGARELEQGRAAITRRVWDTVAVMVDGVRCASVLERVASVEGDGVELRGAARCVARAGTASGAPRHDVTIGFLADATSGHRHLAHARYAGTEVDVVTHRGAPSFALAGAVGEGAAEPAAGEGVGGLFFVGIEHILGGLDHLLFLLGLLVVGGRLRAVVAVITAFTVAHSITLGLAVLRVWTPSPAWIEPIIALSVAWVAFENLRAPDLEHRWRLTFAFGLVHGFGFAGALGELHVPSADVPAALFLFNLGVEAGQLLVLAFVWPIISLARRSEGFRVQGVRALSVGIGVIALYWFVERVLGA